MSHYKIIDSTVSLLYCARCANEDLEVVAPGRLVCRDCGMDVKLDTNLVRVGQLKGTKYKMRSKRQYTFRDIVEEGRQDAFKEKYVPSPDPGKGRVGWRHEEDPEAEAAAKDQLEQVKVQIAGEDDRQQGWRNETLMDLITAETDTEIDDDPGFNAQNGTTCHID
jgi:hypothetical protein